MERRGGREERGESKAEPSNTESSRSRNRQGQLFVSGEAESEASLSLAFRDSYNGFVDRGTG